MTFFSSLNTVDYLLAKSALQVIHALAKTFKSEMDMSVFTMVLAVAISSYLVQQSSCAEMTVYAIGVGQGDSNVIVCPNGKDILLVDMGATRPIYVDKTYGTYLLKEKFGAVKNGMSIHIVVSHSHIDHYSFIASALDKELVPLVSEVVLGGQFDNYGKSFKRWLSTNIENVYSVNNEQKCFGNTDCGWTPIFTTSSSKSRNVTSPNSLSISRRSKKHDHWQFCGSEVDISVLGANIGTTPNARSIVLKIVYNQWSLLLSGDFEGVTAEKELLENWQTSKLQSTYYKMAHHGAWTDFKANMPALLALVQPRRVYISQGYPELSQYRHPNCEAIKHLQDIGTIERINVNVNKPFVCWSGNSTEGSSVVKQGLGLAIYETCRIYDANKKKQTCQDIIIQTDGRDDHTHYVDIPSQFVR